MRLPARIRPADFQSQLRQHEPGRMETHSLPLPVFLPKGLQRCDLYLPRPLWARSLPREHRLELLLVLAVVRGWAGALPGGESSLILGFKSRKLSVSGCTQIPSISL